MSGTSKEPPLSEAQLVDRLKLRYEGDSGNGPGGCVVPQVRNQAGFDARRTIDALGFQFWPSRGLLIDAYECKSSRSDWTRELQDPAKADTFCRLADRFYIVAGRSDVVKVEEVPPDWGLLVPSGDKLREVKPAIVLHGDAPAIQEWSARMSQGRSVAGPRPLPPGFDRSFLIAIIRQAYKVTKTTPQEIEAARRAGLDEGLASRREVSQSYKEMYDDLYNTVGEFEQALGYPIKGYWSRSNRSPKEVGAALRLVLDGNHDAEGLRNQMSNLARNAQALADQARQRVEAIDAVSSADAQLRMEAAS